MLMKDGLNISSAERISGAISQVYPDFAAEQFLQQIEVGLTSLELKQRVNHFIEVLAKHLPADFSACHHIFTQLKPHWDYGEPDDPLRSFAAWPVTDFVAKYGLDHPDLAFDCLRYLTNLFSAEFAIRPFIEKYPELSAKYLKQWATDEDYHVRRLTSEGTRPRLPWGIRLQAFCQNPEPNLALLEQLKDDDSEYVRRSVANHLNDIAKDNPDIVIDMCKRWQKDASNNTQWVIKHACRSLIKSGHPQVFPLLGFTKSPKLLAEDLSLVNSQLTLGDTLTFTVQLTSTSMSNQKLAIDFVIYHMKANGQLSAKVFKLKELTLKSKASIELTKQHKIKAITTRKYYSGKHKIAIQVNGKEVLIKDFNLTVPD
ncbi:DNA alkylation repair protein [Colwellia psychrerythraea]|uniref:DNA alkylation repair enzyme n=1 Tax=Colwellia psychrerythraea TaxID=28229 RepID=A0A099KZ34_COLPS|nr:DNA alkylation repair protein [Colwellia psychrerythraea]KGJ94908.1 DNA alkylation repair enzyme [Colwellia psychrerythraea]